MIIVKSITDDKYGKVLAMSQNKSSQKQFRFLSDFANGMKILIQIHRRSKREVGS